MRPCECCEDAPPTVRLVVHYAWASKRYRVCEECAADLAEGFGPEEVEVVGTVPA